MFWRKRLVRGLTIAVGMIITGIGVFVANTTGRSYFAVISIVGVGILFWVYYLDATDPRKRKDQL